MINPWYVTGFCDGEAAFTYSKTGRTYNLYFSIKQKEDNLQLVLDLQQYFHYIGNIYIQKENKIIKDISQVKSIVYYRVTKREELREIIEHFDKYSLLSPKKKEIYTIWREMVLYKIENYRSIDYNKLQMLAEKLTNLNLKNKNLVLTT